MRLFENNTCSAFKYWADMERFQRRETTIQSCRKASVRTVFHNWALRNVRTSRIVRTASTTNCQRRVLGPKRKSCSVLRRSTASSSWKLRGDGTIHIFLRRRVTKCRKALGFFLRIVFNEIIVGKE